MTRKQERKLLTRRIRKATGIPLPEAATLAKHVLWGSLYWLTRTQPPRKGDNRHHYGQSESKALVFVAFCHWNCQCGRCENGPVTISGPRGDFTPLYDSPDSIGKHSSSPRLHYMKYSREIVRAKKAAKLDPVLDGAAAEWEWDDES